MYIYMLAPFVFKAQEDAEILKSVVMPLEEEIRSLKGKLRDAKDRLLNAKVNVRCCFNSYLLQISILFAH